MVLDRRTVLHTLAASGMAGWVPATAQAPKPSGPPVRIGGSLALSGALANTALMHKIVGEMYVEQLNQRGGLLGRPVEWVLKDDQSKVELTRSLYEQLVTGDQVDLLIGPYGTGAILAAMGVAQRYGKTIVHHTFGIPSLARYERQFPAWPLGHQPEVTMPATVFDALAASGKPPKTVAVLTSKFPSVQFVAAGARKEAHKRGIREVLFLEYEFGNREFSSIANRVKDANPDFVWMGCTGLDGNLLLDAMKNIDYQPRQHFYQYPSPGPLAKAAAGQHALSLTIFEDHPPFTHGPVAAGFVKGFRERARAANLPNVEPETQAAASFVAWQLLEAGIRGAKSLDNQAIAAWLKASAVDTVIGRLRFDGPYNTGDDLSRVKQVQDGTWKVVWPAASAAPGAKPLTA
jgi:branched-chain amino acid transport system substrate-binding protein